MSSDVSALKFFSITGSISRNVDSGFVSQKGSAMTAIPPSERTPSREGKTSR